MIAVEEVLKGYKTAEARWARFGPYYAMFPLDFAFDVIEKYSKPGDLILDPFAGRCSSIYAGSVLGRNSLGIEINPVGWLYGYVKLKPAQKVEVIIRLREVYNRRNYYRRSIEKLPAFYRFCFCDEVLKFLLSARNNLKWQESNIDATLMSIILVYLHGKIGEGLSNQMRMTKSMGMTYSINWWKEKGLVEPPQVNPYDFILSKIEWRYSKGIPNVADSTVIFGDSAAELPYIVEEAQQKGSKFSLLFTSPPYCSVTDYHADQWLRLWLLGGPSTPYLIKDKHKGRFSNKEDYYNLLDVVFGECAKIMSENSVVYVRTDKREFTLNSTIEILKKHYPKHKFDIIDKPFKEDVATQTKLYGDSSLKPGEVDIILTS